ncbi:hypothetical protein ATANTOWER_008378 [Ataeniobius toweri]|uniref:Uncharacterized protein n=1 Tax=Ataeniobius toweri TaxID=208326 RepID=A0ABU7BEK8_9TELE|nr:hypothetical protein [Ataeniobius toweri]
MTSLVEQHGGLYHTDFQQENRTEGHKTQMSPCRILLSVPSAHLNPFISIQALCSPSLEFIKLPTQKH